MKIFAVIVIVLAIGYFWRKHAQAAAATPAGPSGGCPSVGPLTTEEAETCPDDPRAIFAGSGVNVYAAAPSPTQREAPQYKATFDDTSYSPAFMDFSVSPGAVEV